MKKNIKVYSHGEMVDKEIKYIPIRYAIAILITILETLGVLAFLIILTIYIPYFYIAVILTQVVCVFTIIASPDNPDYKIPWLVFVIILPAVGFMIYFMFYSRKLTKSHWKKLQAAETFHIKDDEEELLKLSKIDKRAYAQAKQLCDLAKTHLYANTQLTYFPSGETLFESMISELKKAKKFILMEYFIIDEGIVWEQILQILKDKVEDGIEVYLIYDDIGCMSTLAGNYYKTLRNLGIKATPFSYLKGQANSKFNNRSHRKITVIDNKVGFTGGMNLADEYINHISRFGHWKDSGVRLEGEAVRELTKLFLVDYVTNQRKSEINVHSFLEDYTIEDNNFIVPFGDGPKPVYERRVAKTVLLNMLYQARDYVYMTSPYLIIDNELAQAIENTALRGVRVVIVLPHIPDKKLVFMMTQSYYESLIKAGVEIYEYKPGFIHAKSYISDDQFGVIGTINLDYRSLVHHFENGVWFYNHETVETIKKDFEKTLSESIKIESDMLKKGLVKSMVQSMVRIFSPLL